MRIIVFLIAAVFSGTVWSQDIFDKFAEVLSGASAEESMQSWERELSKKEWLAILENCYDRTVNPDAKEALSEFLRQHDQMSTGAVSERQKNREMMTYCAHALSLAHDVGFKITVIPIAPGNHKTLFRANAVEECYSVPVNGFSESLRAKLRMVIQAQRSVTGEPKSSPVSPRELTVAYIGLCGAVFSKDKEIPVQVTFSER